MKKFSDKYINNYKILSNIKLGFEFEFFSKTMSFYKMLEYLNNYLNPVKVHGFRTYHSDFAPDKNNFKIERDLSGGFDMIELVTGPMEFHTARIYLLKILRFIQEHCYTTDKSSIHVNISYNSDKTDLKLTNLNILKHILMTDEDFIYTKFPERKDNIYAKSVRSVIPFKDYDFSNISIGTVQNNIRIPNDKYYGINYINVNNNEESRRLEYRYIGGKDYEYKSGDIMDLISMWTFDVYNSTIGNFTQEDIDELSEFLNSKISNFKNFSTYDKFLVEFPNIHLQIDQIDHYDIVSSYYPKIYNKIYELVDSTKNEIGCVINYFTKENKFEIIDAEFSSNTTLSNYDFINCKIYSGIFDKCNFINTEIDNSEITRSVIHNCKVEESKVISSKTEASKLHDCYFMSGYLNSHMIGGIFRSGKLGPQANISETTKIANGDNFFGTKEDELLLNDKKGKMKK